MRESIILELPIFLSNANYSKIMAKVIGLLYPRDGMPKIFIASVDKIFYKQCILSQESDNTVCVSTWSPSISRNWHAVTITI